MRLGVLRCTRLFGGSQDVGSFQNTNCFVTRVPQACIRIAIDDPTTIRIRPVRPAGIKQSFVAVPTPVRVLYCWFFHPRFVRRLQCPGADLTSFLLLIILLERTRDKELWVKLGLVSWRYRRFNTARAVYARLTGCKPQSLIEIKRQIPSAFGFPSGTLRACISSARCSQIAAPWRREYSRCLPLRCQRPLKAHTRGELTHNIS
jgi:hypothetical protein